MGRITPSFRQLYEEVMSDLRTELQGAFVDLGHKKAFDLLLKAWSSEQAAMGNSTLPAEKSNYQDKRLTALESKLNANQAN
jgi:hypothetical protein